MTGFGRSQTTDRAPETAPGHLARELSASLHLPHLRHLHLPHLHLPIRPSRAGEGHSSLLDALAHSLDLAGRGYCCTSNPLETRDLETTEKDAGGKTGSEAWDGTVRPASTEGKNDEKLSGK